jgi:flagellar protein FlaG
MDTSPIELRGISLELQSPESSVPRETPLQSKSKREITSENVIAALPEPPNATVASALEQINEKLRSTSSRINVYVDEESKTIVFQLIDDRTGDVIRQVPPDEILKMTRNLARSSEGYFINAKV